MKLIASDLGFCPPETICSLNGRILFVLKGSNPLILAAI